MFRFWFVFLGTILSGAAAGCQNHQMHPILGDVFTYAKIEKSYWYDGINKLPGNVPLEGVDVRLFFDEGITDEVPGNRSAKTDENGSYVIDTTNIPKPKSERGYYYLVAEKPGYERFVGPVYPGLRSHHRKNTIYLKKINNGDNE